MLEYGGWWSDVVVNVAGTFVWRRDLQPRIPAQCLLMSYVPDHYLLIGKDANSLRRVPAKADFGKYLGVETAKS